MRKGQRAGKQVHPQINQTESRVPIRMQDQDDES